MNKKVLAASVAKKTGLTNVASIEVIDAVFQLMKESFEKSESTTIQGFGSFSITQRAERRGVNPSTKKPMTIAARKVVKFNASKKITIK